MGVTKPDMKGDNLHDDPGITMNMMVTDPESVRWEGRVKAGKATINGVSIADKAKAAGDRKEDRRDARHQHRRRHQQGDREQGEGDDPAVRTTFLALAAVVLLGAGVARRLTRSRRLVAFPRAERLRHLDQHAPPDRVRARPERHLENRAAVRPLVAGADARAHLPHRRARREARHHLPRSRHRPNRLGARRAAHASREARLAQRSRRADAGDRRHQRLRVLRRLRADLLRHETGASGGACRSGRSTTSTAWARRRCSSTTRSSSSATRTPTRSCRRARPARPGGYAGRRRVPRRTAGTRRPSSTSRRAARRS